MSVKICDMGFGEDQDRPGSTFGCATGGSDDRPTGCFIGRICGVYGESDEIWSENVRNIGADFTGAIGAFAPVLIKEPGQISPFAQGIF